SRPPRRARAAPGRRGGVAAEANFARRPGAHGRVVAPRVSESGGSPFSRAPERASLAKTSRLPRDAEQRVPPPAAADGAGDAIAEQVDGAAIELRAPGFRLVRARRVHRSDQAESRGLTF